MPPYYGHPLHNARKKIELHPGLLALKVIGHLPERDRDPLIACLDHVRVISHNFGYGIGDDIDSLLARLSGILPIDSQTA
jgi:hypothetical protein